MDCPVGYVCNQRPADVYTPFDPLPWVILSITIITIITIVCISMLIYEKIHRGGFK